jgi:hypothetical protein
MYQLHQLADQFQVLGAQQRQQQILKYLLLELVLHLSFQRVAAVLLLIQQL